MSASSLVLADANWNAAVSRKQFLKRIFNAVAGVTLLGGAVTMSAAEDRRGGGTSAPAVSDETSKRPPFLNSKRGKTTYKGHINFPPEAVFPLLCPVREYEWIETWRCEMVYSDSGVAEDNCVFKTAHGGGQVWSVSRYEPPRRIEFTTFIPDRVVTRLNIKLTPSDGGTEIEWTRIFTGLSEEGNKSVNSWNTEIDAVLTEEIEYFLKTGTMLRREAK